MIYLILWICAFWSMFGAIYLTAARPKGPESNSPMAITLYLLKVTGPFGALVALTNIICNNQQE